MQIHSVQISCFSLGSLFDDACENVRHVKVLPWLSVVQPQEGCYDLSLKGTSYRVDEGKFFIAPSALRQTITHHVSPESGTMRARWLFIDVTLNQNVRLDEAYEFPAVLPAALQSAMQAAFDDLFAATDLCDRYCHCYRILKLLLQVGRPKAMESLDPQMLRAFDYLRTNYAKPFRVRDLARRLNTSESNCYAVFKKRFGTSPTAYLNRFRLSLAEEALKTTDEAIGTIAASVGIPDPLYFNRMFRHAYGVSPSAYRKRFRPQPSRNAPPVKSD